MQAGPSRSIKAERDMIRITGIMPPALSTPAAKPSRNAKVTDDSFIKPKQIPSICGRDLFFVESGNYAQRYSTFKAAQRNARQAKNAAKEPESTETQNQGDVRNSTASSQVAGASNSFIPVNTYMKKIP
jgi:hypothetical protein